MPRNHRPAILIVAFLLLTGGVWSKAEAQRKQPARTRQVNIFLPKDGDPADPQRNPSNLQPVKRTVNPAAPLRPAIEALLQGPTREEARRGYGEHDVRGLYLVKVAIKDGTAYASFAHRKGWAGWSGDLSPLAFNDGVERTLLQFPGVSKTVVCVDGITNFWDESGGPEKKCPAF